MDNFEESLQSIINGINDLRKEIKNLIKLHKKSNSADNHKSCRPNRSHLFNRSKFLEITDQDRLIEFIHQQDIIDKISAAAPHNRITLLRKLIQENLNLNISTYMTMKLINTQMEQEQPEVEVQEPITDIEDFNDTDN